MDIFTIFVSFIGILMSLGYYPQAYTIWKNKSAENISSFTFLIFSIGTLTWLIYGIRNNDIPVIVSFGLGVIGSWLVLFLSIFYKNKR